ncbi:MAG: rod shape-determining protein MreD [Rhodospirillales bacterium]
MNAFQRIDHLGRAAGPAAILLLLILLNAVPLRVPYLSTATPLLPLMAVFHFGLFRPIHLPNWLALAFGLLIDVISGGPLGVNGLVFLCVRYFVEANQRFLADKPFLFVWFGYALVSAGAVAATWALSALLMWRGIDPRPAVFQYLMSLAFYPMASWIIGRSHNGAVARGRPSSSRNARAG